MTALAMAMIEGGGHTPSTAQFLDPSLEFVPRHCAVSHINVRYARSCRWLAGGWLPRVWALKSTIFARGTTGPIRADDFWPPPTMPGIISVGREEAIASVRAGPADRATQATRERPPTGSRAWITDY